MNMKAMLWNIHHFKVGNMSRDKTEYQISKIGHVQHSRLVLRHAIQIILYGRIVDYL